MERTEKTQSLSIFARRKAKGEKIVVLTAYDLTSALIASNGDVDAILVGDSLGMVVLGHETTLPVTMDDMLRHCAAVSRAKPQVPIIADMPYGSFHVSPEEAVRAALRLVKEGGVQAVKVEGGSQREGVIRALIDAEIPVMGHLGLTPQSINKFGGFKVQGRQSAAAKKIQADAALLAQWGCFSLVLECVPAALSETISAQSLIPTIGIGAGAGCDGQVLVFHDMLGLFPGFTPRFVKRYAELGDVATEAVRRYTTDVRTGVFPGPEHTYGDKKNAAASTSKSDTAGGSGYLGDMQED